MSCELKNKDEFIIDDVKLKEITEKFQIDKMNVKKIYKKSPRLRGLIWR
jgi:predicted DNA-binding protein YlxM (UPF0122 family)